MIDWIPQAVASRDAALPGVLVTVAGVRGSAPREVGAKMLVTETDLCGSIGGGELEYQCSRIATKLLAEEGGGFLRRFPLGSNCGQCCGGVVDVLFEPLCDITLLPELEQAWQNQQQGWLLTVLDDNGHPHKAMWSAGDDWQGDESAVAAGRQLDTLSASDDVARRMDTPGRSGQFLLLEPLQSQRFDIAVFGAGHVGSALVQILSALDCRIRWIDSRQHIFPERLPVNVQAIISDSPEREVQALPATAFAVVMTHSHALDLGIVAAILRRGGLVWCGLIGSATKRRRFRAKLEGMGFTGTELAALTCPIGIDGVTGKKPQEIAIAVAAQLLALREQQQLASGRSDPKLSLVGH